MIKSTKIISSIVLALALSACASTSPKVQLSQNLGTPPAIDVAYSDVVNDIKANIGLNVRWGGEVVGSRKVGEVTELTVLSSKLDRDSRPIPRSIDDFADRRFIITVADYEKTLLRQYVTVFGPVTGERTLVNGPRTKVIPVVAAIETMPWDPKASNSRRNLAHSKFDHRGRHFNSFSRFDNRGFSRFGHFNRFGSSNRFRTFGRFNRFSRFDGFGRNRFGRGFRSGSRFGGSAFYGWGY